MTSAKMDITEILNILGIIGQLAGFVILALDLWPEYSKSKKRQMLTWLLNFSTHLDQLFSEDLTDSQPYRAGLFYLSNKENVMASLKEARKHAKDPLIGNWDHMIRREAFQPYFEKLKAGYGLWLENIQTKKTYRNMFVGEGIMLVIAGYIAQLISALIAANPSAYKDLVNML